MRWCQAAGKAVGLFGVTSRRWHTLVVLATSKSHLGRDAVESFREDVHSLVSRIVRDDSQVFGESEMRVGVVLRSIEQPSDQSSDHICRSESAEQRSALHNFRRLLMHGRRAPVSKCEIAVG